MVIINYPKPDFKIRNDGGKESVFDALRKKWVILTPEEWVRQNIIQYLLSVKEYPATLIAVEKEIKLGELKKRFDILVYDKTHKPWMMIECKAMDIKLDESVLQQVLRYNLSVPARFLVITNGNDSFIWENKSGELNALSSFPDHM